MLWAEGRVFELCAIEVRSPTPIYVVVPLGGRGETSPSRVTFPALLVFHFLNSLPSLILEAPEEGRVSPRHSLDQFQKIFDLLVDFAPRTLFPQEQEVTS